MRKNLASLCLIAVFVELVSVSPARCESPFAFRHHFIDADVAERSLGQTALVDLDSDGDLDFITGVQRGNIYWYEYRSADDWQRHLLGTNSPSDVGGSAHDVNRDGHPDFVAGGVWYENPGQRERTFLPHAFDPDLAAVHDLIVVDVDGDGHADVVTMSDKNDLRWYRVADEAKAAWQATKIGPAVHSGISAGDIDRDGDVDIVRSNVWFENLGQGRTWRMHRMTEPWGAAEPNFAVNATQTETMDVNGDGRLDVVICDGENPQSKIAWLEAPTEPRHGDWMTHHLPRGDDAPRGALHSLRLGDFDGDGDLDILTVEMERFRGARHPRWFIWENFDRRGSLREHVILDEKLGGHETVVGDVDRDGDLDIISKPWSPYRENAVGGTSHIDYLENLAKQAAL